MESSEIKKERLYLPNVAFHREARFMADPVELLVM